MSTAAAYRAPLVEALESRRLLAGDVAFVNVDVEGTLVVQGSSQADHVVISLNPETAEVLDVNLNGMVISFAVSQITNGIRVDAGRGNDVVVIDETYGPVTLAARLYGGRSARVARGARLDRGRVVESWTLISPYPSADLGTLHPGTMRLILTVAP
jgi:hypothetical protein